MTPLDIKKIREDFPILKRRIRGKPLNYLDNAATTQKPRSVIAALTDFYENHNANIHRGVHTLSDEATQFANGATVAFVVGGSALAAAGVLGLVIAVDGDDEPAADVSATAAVGPGGIQLGLRF